MTPKFCEKDREKNYQEGKKKKEEVIICHKYPPDTEIIGFIIFSCRTSVFMLDSHRCAMRKFTVSYNFTATTNIETRNGKRIFLTTLYGPLVDNLFWLYTPLLPYPASTVQFFLFKNLLLFSVSFHIFLFPYLYLLVISIEGEIIVNINIQFVTMKYPSQ